MISCILEQMDQTSSLISPIESYENKIYEPSTKYDMLNQNLTQQQKASVPRNLFMNIMTFFIHLILPATHAHKTSVCFKTFYSAA